MVFERGSRLNIIEASQHAVDGRAIMNLDRNEWIIYSSGAFRWKSNRQPATFSPKDIQSTKWISEDDLITISKLQIEDALKNLWYDAKTNEIVGHEKFMAGILSAAKTNSMKEEQK
jgi:hypothetical protein